MDHTGTSAAQPTDGKKSPWAVLATIKTAEAPRHLSGWGNQSITAGQTASNDSKSMRSATAPGLFGSTCSNPFSPLQSNQHTKVNFNSVPTQMASSAMTLSMASGNGSSIHLLSSSAIPSEAVGIPISPGWSVNQGKK